MTSQALTIQGETRAPLRSVCVETSKEQADKKNNKNNNKLSSGSHHRASRRIPPGKHEPKRSSFCTSTARVCNSSALSAVSGNIVTTVFWGEDFCSASAGISFFSLFPTCLFVIIYCRPVHLHSSCSHNRNAETH